MRVSLVAVSLVGVLLMSACNAEDGGTPFGDLPDPPSLPALPTESLPTSLPEPGPGQPTSFVLSEADAADCAAAGWQGSDCAPIDRETRAIAEFACAETDPTEFELVFTLLVRAQAGGEAIANRALDHATEICGEAFPQSINVLRSYIW